MCGFLGEFSFNGVLTAKDDFLKLLNLSVNRGPDDMGYFKETPFQFGFNRLAILEVSEKGRQPMVSPTGKFIVNFNGEIYNYKDLIKNYELNDINSNSDTEVLVKLLDILGVEGTIKQLNGMFAVSIVDLKTSTLYLARDYAGIKPLFYGVREEGVVFASQFNQVLNHKWFKGYLKLRPSVIKEYLAVGYMPAPNTIFEDIMQVNPGEVIQVDKAGNISKINSVQFLGEQNVTNDFEEKERDFDKVLTNAVKRQMVSDVPLGTFLSGGIDSPLVSALAKKQKSDIIAFTYSTEDEKLDESKKAIQYAKYIDIHQNVDSLSEQDVMCCIHSHLKGLPEPFGDYSSVPTYIISQKAKESNSVMLSGDGGDELFLGYPRMRHLWKKRRWFYIPWELRKPLIRTAIKLGLEQSWGPYSYKSWDQWVLSRQRYVSLKYLDKIIPNVNYSLDFQKLYSFNIKKTNSREALHWLRYNEFYGHLQRVLVKVDRMSMDNSLEVRVPFLDKEVVEWAWKGLPKIRKGTFELKGNLKKVMNLYYPKEMIETEKKGFSSPLESWLKGPLNKDLKESVVNSDIFGQEFIESNALKQYVQDFLEEKHNEFWGVWHVYVWQKWAKKEGLI